MNRFLTALLVILLATGTIFNGVTLLQSDSNVRQTQIDISSLSNDNATLEASLVKAQSDEASLSSSITALQNSIAQLNTTVQTLGQTVAAAVTKIQPSVVYVEVTYGRNQGGASGSGVIIRSNGYVLTNQHVVDQAASITVTLATDDLSKGTTFTATVVKASADLDLAILKLNTTRTDLPAATMGSASDVSVGKTVIACGFPLGTDLLGSATFTAGIVSAIRTMPSSYWTELSSSVNINYIQTDTAITHGNSGDGLFTLDGKFIGVPSYGFGDSGAAGFNFAIPMDTVLPFVQSVIG